MGAKTKVRELLLYSEQIKESDVRNLFNQILKSRLPLFGFLDFTDFFSPNFINIITKRRLNTVQFFARERPALAGMSLLVFPYKVSELSILERERGSMLPFPKLYMLTGTQDFLSFALKESILEVDMRISKILGKSLGFGTAVDEHGRRSLLVSTNPERFFVVDLEKNPSVYIEILDPIPKRMSVTSRFPVFEETGISVGVDNFDIFQHTLVIGASGTGKSKGLFALIKAIRAMHKDDLRIVIIDPHGEFIRMFPEEYIVDLVHNYIEPLDVGGNKTPLMTQLISQLLSSAIGGDNKYSERVLFYAVHLLSSIDSMNLKNVSLLLTDSSKRAEFISSVENDEIKRFFDEEFNDIYIHHFNDAILPVLNFVGEYELYLGKAKKKEDLLGLIGKNPITVVSFNPNFFGKRMINFLAGAVINQMYILAITEKLNMPTILVMDEFQRVETKVVRDMLSETSKFNLYAYISMQYLGQMTKEVHDSIVSNIRNIIAFKLNKQDATSISSIMEIKIEESFKKARTQTELEESKKEMFVRLHKRECIVRLFDGKKYILPMKLRVVDIARWGYKPSMEVSMMDAMHDREGEEKPQATPAQEAPSRTEEQGQPFSYNVEYGTRASIKTEEAKPEKPKGSPFEMKDELMHLKDEEVPEEEKQEGKAEDEEELAPEEPALEEEELPPEEEKEVDEEHEEEPEERQGEEKLAERLRKIKERAMKMREAGKRAPSRAKEEEEPSFAETKSEGAPESEGEPQVEEEQSQPEEEPIEEFLPKRQAKKAPARKPAAKKRTAKPARKKK